MSKNCPKCFAENPDSQKFCGECATPLPDQEKIIHTQTVETPVEELTTGATFAGRYHVIEKLGKGGMGKVYRVLDNELNKEIALKLIRPEIAGDKKTIERFKSELKLARKISHRNVGRMFELLDNEGLRYITMEYVPGGDLKKFIRRSGALNTGKAISIARQICEGLSEAHNLGIIHRDLKPQNIMIDDDGNVRIMDFGIARSIKGKGITGSGVMIGTPEYMSPEQAEAKEVDQRSDLYSLGVILYEMTTGRLPFEGDTALAIAMKHKGETAKDPKEYNLQIPDDLSGIILKCLEKDKDNRYQTARDIMFELENIEKGLPTTSRVIPKKTSLTSKEITVSLSVKKLLFPLSVVLAVLLAGLLIWHPWSKEKKVPIASGKPSLAVVYFENNTGEKSLDHWRKALCELLITDLTQSKYIRVLSSDRLIDILHDLDQIEGQGLSSTFLKQVAARGGATYILRGSFTKAGEQFRIDAILQEVATMESIGSERIEGRGEESFLSMVDELTRKVKAHLELSADEIAGDIDENVEKITTSSPKALDLYIEGRKCHVVLDYERSIELMEQAVSIDPEFAMAYRSLAVSHGNLGYFNLRNKYMEKALQLTDRLPLRQRYLIEGDFYSPHERTWGKAIEAYKRLLELYEDDSTGNHNLAILYDEIGDLQKAIEYFEINRKNGNLNLLGYGNLAATYRQVDSYDKAHDVLEESLKKYSNEAAAYLDLALHYIMDRKYDLALNELDKASALEPTSRHNVRLRARINMYRDDLDKAQEDFNQLLNLNQPQAQYFGSMGLINLNILQGKFDGTEDILLPMIAPVEQMGIYWVLAEIYLISAYIDLRAGNLKEALKECDTAFEYGLKDEDMERQRRALQLKGDIYLQMNALEKSIEALKELEALSTHIIHPHQMHYFHYLKGKIELKRNNFADAIKHLEEAINLETKDPRDRRVDYVEALARAYFVSDTMDKAQTEYERIASSNVDRIDRGDIYAGSHYMLGKIYESKGWRGKAIESYEKFLELWKDADPGTPEVEDAAKRLVVLKK